MREGLAREPIPATVMTPVAEVALPMVLAVARPAEPVLTALGWVATTMRAHSLDSAERKGSVLNLRLVVA